MNLYHSIEPLPTKMFFEIKKPRILRCAFPNKIIIGQNPKLGSN